MKCLSNGKDEHLANVLEYVRSGMLYCYPLKSRVKNSLLANSDLNRKCQRTPLPDLLTLLNNEFDIDGDILFEGDFLNILPARSCSGSNARNDSYFAQYFLKYYLRVRLTMSHLRQYHYHYLNHWWPLYSSLAFSEWWKQTSSDWVKNIRNFRLKYRFDVFIMS